MMHALAPIAAALFIWWFGTGLVLAAGRLAPEGRRLAFVGLTAAAVIALGATVALADDRTPAGAYAGFTAGVVLWAWHEASFLFGYITGSRRSACPPDARGWRRFLFATQTLIHHELAIFATLAALVALTWGAANTVAAASFGLLWAMRLSAKINLFLGVPNFADEFLPARLVYLKTYFGPRVTNLLFPATAALSIGVTAAAFTLAWRGEAEPFVAVSWALLGTMAGLAALEHGFLVTPWREGALWRFLLPDPADAALSAPPPRRAPQELT